MSHVTSVWYVRIRTVNFLLSAKIINFDIEFHAAVTLNFIALSMSDSVSPSDAEFHALSIKFIANSTDHK